jgi:hypothetical protein
MEHCEITNHTSGLLYHGDNITMDYVNVHAPIFTAGSSGIKSHSSVETDCTNITISNCMVWDIGDTASGDSSGSYGIQTEGMYNTVSNCSVDGVRYVAFNLKGNYSTFEDLDARNATHNMIEAQASNSIYRDIVIGNSVTGSTDSALFTALEDDEGVGNVTFENIVIEDTYTGSGGAIKLVSDGQFALEDYIYKNITSGYGHLYLSGIKNVQFINVSMDFMGVTFFQIEDVPSNSSEKSRNIDFIDCSLTNGSSSTYVGQSYNVSFANTLTDTFNTFTDANYTVLYPVNILITDNQSNPLPDATVTLNVTTFGLNGLGEYSTTGTTDSTGKLNYSERLYVPDFMRDSALGYTYYTVNTIQVSKGIYSNETAFINPDSTWYTPTADLINGDYNGTLYTLVLDAEGVLTILSFTPTDTTPSSTNGTEQTFTATFSETVDSAEWLIDGNHMEWDNSTTTASYSNSTASVGTYNVTVIGTGDGGTVSKVSWVWTVEAGWTPTPGTHYIGVPETHSWIGGEWVVTYSGTYTEAQTEVTGVEIRP